jgi:hypothetical protein
LYKYNFDFLYIDKFYRFNEASMAQALPGGNPRILTRRWQAPQSVAPERH